MKKKNTSAKWIQEIVTYGGDCGEIRRETTTLYFQTSKIQNKYWLIFTVYGLYAFGIKKANICHVDECKIKQ